MTMTVTMTMMMTTMIVMMITMLITMITMVVIVMMKKVWNNLTTNRLIRFFHWTPAIFVYHTTSFSSLT